MNARPVVIAASGTVLLVVFAMISSWMLYWKWAPQEAGIERQPQMPAPRLQEPPLDASQPATMARLRAEEKKQLTSYKWINQDQRVARIPIERAMQLSVDEGLPQWQPPNAPVDTE